MIIRHQFPALFLIFFSCLLTACQPKLTPDQITEKFWQAIQIRDIEKLHKYSIDVDPQGTEELPQVNSFSTGKIVIDGDEANIETIIELQMEGETLELQLITYLEQIDGNWRVDYESTTGPLSASQEMTVLMDEILQEMTEEITGEIEESVEEIKEKAIPEIKSRMEQAEKEFRKKLPELKNVIKEFLQELEKSIEESIQAPEEETTVET